MRWLLPSLAVAVFASGCPGDAPSKSRDGGGFRYDVGGNDGARQLDADRPRVDSSPPESDGPPPDAPPPDAGKVYTGKPGEFSGTTSDGRSFKLYVPKGYSASQPIGLAIGFHGSGDSGSNFYQFVRALWGSAAEPANLMLLVPNTKSPYSDFAIWSGNPTNDVQPMEQEMDAILALVNNVSDTYRVDPKQLHAFGFSNGGLFAAVAGMSRSQELASLTIIGYGWGGSGYPLVTPARTIPVQFVCGTADSFYSAAQSSEQYLKGQGHATAMRAASSAGHSFSQVMSKVPATTLVQWMKAHPLP